MKIEIDEKDCEKIVEQLITEIAYRLDIQQIQREIVNKTVKQLKDELINSSTTKERIQGVLIDCEKTINSRLNSKITEKINNLDFQIKLK